MDSGKGHHSASPTVVLRISDGPHQMRRAFSDYSQALRAAEAYAGAGFVVAMVSSTGRFLMRFQPRWLGIAI
jgi:hypothetical protein